MIDLRLENPQALLILVIFFVVAVVYLLLIRSAVKLFAARLILPSLATKVWNVALLSLVGQLLGVLWLFYHKGIQHAIDVHILEERLYIVFAVYGIHNVALINLLNFIRIKFGRKHEANKSEELKKYAGR